MRRGCVASEEIPCDGCHRTIPYAGRYLAIDENDGVEVEKGKTAHYCVECALKKKGLHSYYAAYTEEKEEKTLTFFPDPEW